MQIPLTPELEKLIQEKVSSGCYASAIDVIGESLRLLDERDVLSTRERDRSTEARLTELRQKIQVGIQELDQGLEIDGDDVFAELEADIQAAEVQSQATEESA